MKLCIDTEGNYPRGIGTAHDSRGPRQILHQQSLHKLVSNIDTDMRFNTCVWRMVEDLLT